MLKGGRRVGARKVLRRQQTCNLATVGVAPACDVRCERCGLASDSFRPGTLEPLGRMIFGRPVVSAPVSLDCLVRLSVKPQAQVLRELSKHLAPNARMTRD